MQKKNHVSTSLSALLLGATLMFSPAVAQIARPDLTAFGVIEALQHKGPDGKYDGHIQYGSNSSRSYDDTYNLGATGMRGWINDFNPRKDARELGFATELSLQILVTTVGPDTPASRVGMQKDDVILGVSWGNNPINAFSSDARKTLGVAIVEAEKMGNGGNLNVRFWRAGTPEAVVQMKLDVMGDYQATAPSIPKSTAILNKASKRLIQELKTDPYFFSSLGKSFSGAGAVNALALLSAVAPTDPDYPEVQLRLRSFVASMNAPVLDINPTEDKPTWRLAYENIFLSEYYLHTFDKIPSTPDLVALDKLEKYTVALARAQGRYGTFGHGGSVLKSNGNLHGTIPPYGAVNGAGVPANLSIVLGKIALSKGGRGPNPEIDSAIGRANRFFAYYVNKGTIPYGEHRPEVKAYSLNSKDQACAVMFALQNTYPSETEYFSRISIAGYNGREEGHNGNGFNYLWEGIGANVGGPFAVARYMEKIQWNLDLERRSDGSFTYDGQRTAANAGSSTSDGSYFGVSQYYGLNPTATHILTYSAPLKRLYITGKNTTAAALSNAKVDSAIAAGSFQVDCENLSYSNENLIAYLSDYNPMTRQSAAEQLLARNPSMPLSADQKSRLIASITNGPTLADDVNARVGACTVLGLLKVTSSLPFLNQRLHDTDPWVRAQAASALANFGPAAVNHLDSMLAAVVVNATDAEETVWNDPCQIANGFLCNAVFAEIKDFVTLASNSDTKKVNRDLLYPALRVGLTHPDGNIRNTTSAFVSRDLGVEDVKWLAPELIHCVTSLGQANTMFGIWPRKTAIEIISKHNFAEAIPLSLGLVELPRALGWNSKEYQASALDALTKQGDSARWTLPRLQAYVPIWEAENHSLYQSLNTSISLINGAISEPIGITNLLAVATSQTVATAGPKAIILSGTTCRNTNIGFSQLTSPEHGTLSGTAPNLIYTPTGGYTGPDSFTFRVVDTVTTSEPGTVSIIVGAAGNGLKGEYFDNADFTNPKLTRTDSQVNFDWATGSPDALVGVDTFSVRWTGQLLVPETATYKFSSFSSDGVRLYVNGALVLDGFADKSTSWTDGTSINLTAGQRVELMMEYYENTGSAVAKLKWTGPSFAGLNGKTIGQEWFYSGASATNRVAYAHPQNLTMVKNTTQAITLAGSGVVTAPLTYTVVGMPTNGSLLPNGSSSNWLYSPNTNFTGTDSFSFFVNNGNGNSATVTVSLTVLGGISTPYFWTNSVDGNWNDTNKWTNSMGAAAFPAVGGQDYYNLNFNKTGTYTTTQNHGSPFLFNQLNVGGSVSISGANSLTASTNGPFAPKINQNSNDRATVNTPVILAAATTLGGSGSGVMNFMGNISGSGSLTMSNNGRVILDGVNTYTGGTVINSGALEMGVLKSSAFGPGSIKVNSGSALILQRGTMNNSLSLNNATLIASNGWRDDVWSGAVGLTGTTIIDLQTTGGFNISGVISGPGGFKKMGDNTILTLSGANTYTGATTVGAGTVNCTSASALGQGPVALLSGGKLNLAGGSRQVASLSLGGVGQPQGTYGSTASSATTKNDTYFSGSGILSVPTPNTPPVPTAQNVSASEDVAKPITLSATDAEGNALDYTILTLPTRGYITGKPPNVTYNPSTNFNGMDDFTFKVNDGTSDSAVATVSIAVTAVNDPPVVTSQSVTTAEDTPRAIILPAYDVDNSVLNYWTGNSTNGIISGTFPNFTFTPTLNFNGVATFEYSVNDGTVNSPNATVYVNVTPVNDAPVANAQSVSAVVGSSSAVTLAGTDVDGNSLTYSIVSQPTRGTVTPLTGSRNVTYTPTGTNVGPDSFTFKVNDGTVDSPTATVSVSVTNSTFTWNTTSNNWSNAASWTSGAPGAAGQAAYVLNFNLAGSYTATNDLNSGFVLNRINFGSNVTLAGNRLTLSLSGATSPVLNQNSANLVTVANNLELNAATTLSGTSSGAMNFTGNVFGSGGLVKSCAGDVYLNGTNSYTGGTTITAGALHMGLQKNSALGSGLVTLNPGATLVLNRVSVVNSLSLNSATLLATNGFGDGWSGPISLSGTSIMDLQTTGNLTLSGVISGAGGLTKVGNSSTLTLSGTSNSYTGTTTVSAGTLACTNAAALGKGALALATGAKLNLTFSGITQASTLSLGGIAQGNGTYGSTTSSATNKNDTWFSGSGVLNVGPVPSVPFTWNTASSNMWSTVGSWTSGNPVAAGQSNYALNFNVAGSYTATHNLNAGFIVNQLNFGGSSVTLAGNSLALTANVSAAPQLNQNSTSTVTVSNSLALNATTVLGGTSSGAMSLTGVISGAGGLIKNCSGDVALNGINTYSGGTTVNAGSLSIGLQKNAALGSGSVTLNSGSVLWLNRVSIANSLTLNSATLYATNGFGDAWSGPITLSGTSTFNLQTTGNLTLSGVIGGSGGMTKAGNSTTLTLSGTSNSYTGTTIISGGTIACTNVGSLGQGSLEVATGAKLNLAFSGTGQVSSLSLGGTSQPSGTYGSTASSATNKNDTYFSGTGVINVASVLNARMAAVQSRPTNSAPVFTAKSIVMGGASQRVAYTGKTLAGKATDADAGDTLTYSKVSGPAWLAVASSGALSGTPPTGSAGLNSFVVRVTDSASATADTGLQIKVTGLPAPWVIGSIGKGMLRGSTSYRRGTFSQSGSGVLGTTRDKLSFSYQTLTGDGEIIAKISALQDTGTLSGVGVMIRETLAANSTYVFMGMSGSNTYRLASRTTTGGTATSLSSGSGIVPNTWVKLVRSGNVITASKSSDGATWTLVGNTTVTMATNCYIGLAVSSGSDTTLNASQFSNLSVTP